jgi:two-component system phosphate regulon response regulator PhoB
MVAQPLPLVLVVDDEPFVGRVLRMLLAEASMARVSIAGSVAEMWELLAEERPDLMLLDVLLPDGHGLGLLRQFRESEEWADLPVLIMTGVVGLDEGAPDLRLAQGVVSKPISPKRLLRAVGELLPGANDD